MQEDKTEGRVWAVVHSVSGKKYIGCIEHASIKETAVRLFETNSSIQMTGAFELTTAMMPAPDPHTQQMGMKHIVQPMPVDACQQGATIYVRAGAINFFDDMSKEDKTVHLDLLRRLEDQLQTQRAKRAGIILDGVPRIPTGHGRS
jgi:hypothetical protein